MNEYFLKQAREGKMYHACSAGAVTLSTLSATCTGLVLSNPPGSGKNLEVAQVRFQPSTSAGGAAVVGIAISPSISQTAVVHTTPMVIHRSILRGSNNGLGVGRVDAAATLPDAPVWLRTISSAGGAPTPGMYLDEPEGGMVVPPGANISLSYLVAIISGIASISWVEVDI